MEVQALHQNIHFSPSSIPNPQQYASDDDDFESGNSTAKLYERSRIKALADEREYVQKKTFTKWINCHLDVVKCGIEELYMDLRDGKMLLKLLEILSGERLPKPTRGKMRIHCLENVDKALTFLSDQHVHLENVGAHDIVDGNARLTLGLIWTIILRFQIQDIIMEEYQTTETRNVKDTLLLWCQMKTAGYNNVNIRNFSTSWRDGLAFNALIHKHRPDLVEYSKLVKAKHVDNLNNAFDTAEDKLKISKLLDPKDIDVEQPDEKSVMTYVATLYAYFNSQKAQSVQSKRVDKVIRQAIDIQDHIKNYEDMTSDLLRWIQQTIVLLREREFANSLKGVQKQLSDFNSYRQTEKPPRFDDKGLIEEMLFLTQSKIRACNQNPYSPPEGKMIADINNAWENLEREEHAREIALRDEMIRQERLDHIAARFDRKAGMREQWLADNLDLVAQDNFGNDLAAVEAATKKHEAIETDIFAYSERVQAVLNVARDLENEGYYDIQRIKVRNELVTRLWQNLQELLGQRRARLNLSLELHKVFQEMIYLQDSISEIATRLKSDDLGKHLMGVEDLLQKHNLTEADIRALGGRIDSVIEDSKRFIDGEFPQEVGTYRPVEPDVVRKRGEELRAQFEALNNLSKSRQEHLLDSRKMWQFFREMEDEKEWIKEKNQLMTSPDIGRDLSSVERLQRKHRALNEECQGREILFKKKLAEGQELISAGNVGKEIIKQRMQEMNELWEQLVDRISERMHHLNESQEVFQLLGDCDDADTFLSEQDRIVKNEDVGTKLAVTESLIKNNVEVQLNLTKFKDTINQLNNTGAKVSDYSVSDANTISSRLDSLNLHYANVLENVNKRADRLNNALSMYKLFDESDTVRTWITEKEKLLTTLVPGDEITELEVVRHRFECFEKEMATNAQKVGSVNELSSTVLSRDHPDSSQIQHHQDELNTTWNQLADLVEERKKSLETAYRYNQFLTEATETGNWIKDKAQLIESTDELGNDLEGIMQLQRRLGGLQRDLQAIQAKIDHLDNEASILAKDKPEAVSVIKEERNKIEKLWLDLNNILKERDDRLNDSSELQHFLQDLDHFQSWLSKTQTTIASEDIPQSLQEAERLLQEHQLLKAEIAGYEPDFKRLMDYGSRVTEGQTDAQYMFLHQRLNGIAENWEVLKKMYDDRTKNLQNAVEAQTFFRDAHQIDVFLNKQENYLSKEDVPILSTSVKPQQRAPALIDQRNISFLDKIIQTARQEAVATIRAPLEEKAETSTHEVAQELMRTFENFQKSLGGNDPRLVTVLEYGQSLVQTNPLLQDKIRQKCDQIKKKREDLDRKTKERNEQLKQQLRLQEFLQEIQDVEEWIGDKAVIVSEDPSRDRSLAAMYSRFKAFEGELEANKDKLDRVIHEGQKLKEEYPQLSSQVEPKIAALKNQWEDLNEKAREKSVKLADANREKLFDETARSVMTWITEVRSQVVTTTEEVTEEIGLVEINEQMKDQDKKDTELAAKRRLLQDMQLHAEKLKEQYPERREEFEQVHQEVRLKLTELEAPLSDRRDKLAKQKRVRQFMRDIYDELDWCRDKQKLVQDAKVGNSLLTAQQMKRRHRMLANEVENHERRINAVCQDGEEMIREGHPQSEHFRSGMSQLTYEWDNLKKLVEERARVIDENEVAQQYLFDASEAEAWMGEQELYLMGDERERAKDEQSVSNATKRQEQLHKTVETYGDEIRALGYRSRLIAESGHPEADTVTAKLARVDKMYAGLRDLCSERKQRLEDLRKLYSLLKEIMDLEAWIAERTQLASSHELGADYEHNCVLRDRFAEFSRETNEQGKVRVASANELCNSLIDQGHTESAEIAECKDRINEAWADLLELIETRIQHLKAAWDLHKFYSECQDVLDRIAEKSGAIPEDLGRDAKAATSLQRKHTQYENELQRLAKQVEDVRAEAALLLPKYAHDKEHKIQDKTEEIMDAWRRLQCACEQRKVQLHNACDLHRFLSMYRKLRTWMESMQFEMANKERPRDVSGVELLMNNHRSVMAEIEARDENFSVCLSLGRNLLNRRHPMQEEVRANCIDLVTRRINLLDDWRTRREHLELMLEVYQYAREAAVAEAWLLAQEPYLKSQDLGESLDETLALLKKHAAFERHADTQKERFENLKRLTNLEMRAQRSKEAEAARQLEKEQSIAQAIKEFQILPPLIQAGATGQLASTPGGTPRKAVQSGAPGTPTSVGHRDSIEGKTAGARAMKGNLVRKHEWESSSKKASARSWHTLFFVLDINKNTLAAYKDERRQQDGTYHQEPPLSLAGCKASIASNYTKRANVFRIRIPNGGETLYQANNDTTMLEWVNAINSCSQGTPQVGRGSPSTSGVTRSATLPPQTSAQPSSGRSTHDTSASSSSGIKSKFLTLGRKKDK